MNIPIIAHRGYALESPENSAVAIAAAGPAGADWVELDVRMTSDGVLVLSHDPDLVGLSVSANSYSQLRAAHPSLARVGEAIEAAQGLEGINLEIKVPVARPIEMVEKLGLETSGWEGHLLISSFLPGLLPRFRALRQRVRLGLLSASAYDPDGATALDTARSEGFEVALPQDGAITEGLVKAAHEADIELMAWTVNDAKRIKQLASWGVDGLITDYPSLAEATIR